MKLNYKTSIIIKNSYQCRVIITTDFNYCCGCLKYINENEGLYIRINRVVFVCNNYI
uniref:Uncharacterized protein n=1 Tax=Bartonella rochalimae ATCC BAA-1498 TaxID=685782 RepID=E6YLB0_9HYPH|nr:hypothetical protein BARRO_30229 [Bartonella rochalimae ATCC BAA-1498]